MTEGIFWIGHKVVWIRRKAGIGEGRLDIFVVYTNEEKVDWRKENPIAKFMRVRVEAQLDCRGVKETPDVSMEVAEIPSVQNCLMSIPEKDTHEVVGSILARPFYTTS